MANEIKWRLVLDSKDFSGPAGVAQKEAEKLIKTLSESAGPLGQMAAAMGPAGMAIAAGVGAATLAVGLFAKATLDGAIAAVQFAGNVSDLSTKTGIAGEALQVLGQAGSLVGVSMEEAATAVMKMQQHMVKAPEDFRQLGLEVEKLRKLAPEKQFEAVGKAIQSIQDPAQKTAATIAFFGKSGQEAMKLLSVDIDKVGESARDLGNIMDDSTRLALDALGDSATVLSTTWEHLWMNIGGAVAETPAVRDALDAVTEALGDLSRFIQLNSKDIQGLITAAVVPMGAALTALLRGVQFMVSAFIQWKTAIAGVRDSLKGGWIETAVRAMGGSLGGGRSGNKGPEMLYYQGNYKGPAHGPGWIDPAILAKDLREREAANAKEQAEAAKMEAFWFAFRISNLNSHNEWFAEQERMANAKAKRDVEHYIEEKKILEARAEAHRKLQQEVAQVVNEMAAQETQDQIAALEMFGDALREIGTDTGGALGGFIDGLGAMVQGYAVGAQAAVQWVNATNNAQKAMTVMNVAMTAWRGGALQGAAAGATFGSSFGPMGTAIGAAAGALIGWIGGASRARQEAMRLANETRNLRNEYIASAGGIDHLRLKAAEAGVSLSAMMNASKPEEYRAAVERVQHQFDLLDEATRLTEEAMDRWGISVEQMGPKFQAQKLHQGLAEIYRDFELLTVQGADAAAMLSGPMGDAINEMVQHSVAAGIALPESIRPMIEKMIELGLLFDETGAVITDVGQLNFTEDLESGVRALIQSITELVNALRGIPSNINTNIHVTQTHENNQGGGGQHNVNPHDGETISAAEGFYSPALPQDAFFQLHKGERVEVTPADETPMRNKQGGGDGAPPAVNVYIGGERLAGVIQRQIRAGMIRVDA